MFVIGGRCLWQKKYVVSHVFSVTAHLAAYADVSFPGLFLFIVELDFTRGLSAALTQQG